MQCIYANLHSDSKRIQKKCRMVRSASNLISWLFQAMLTRHSSTSTRKLSKALDILTQDKCLVAISDYNEFHKTVKRHLVTSVWEQMLRLAMITLISTAVSICSHYILSKIELIINISIWFSETTSVPQRHPDGKYFKPIAWSNEDHSQGIVNFRKIFDSELFGVALKEVSSFCLWSCLFYI